MKEHRLTAGVDDSELRIDQFLVKNTEGFSRSFLQKCVKNSFVSVNGTTVKANYRLRKDDEVRLLIPPCEELSVKEEKIPLDIIYEDDSLLLVNKPKGMVVHPAAGHYEGTLVNALMFHCKNALSGINGILRPGIVHRIDKDTTGILVVCKTDEAHRFLAEQLAVHSITRRYRAIVYGAFKDSEFTIETTIGRHPSDRKKMACNVKNGKHAVTEVRLIKELKGYSYIECTLLTGRTHQIRVHMASIGHPVLGDTLYGPKKSSVKGLEGQTLHAYMIGFIHPVTKAYVEYSAPLPEYFQQLLEKLV